LVVKYELNWSRATLSQTFDISKSEIGRLFEATSLSPCLCSGVTSDNFHALGNTPVSKIAVEKPVCVKKTCRIIVDTTNLGHPDDILADDCGVWITNGSPKVYKYNLFAAA
jgi:AraC-like DNA-binding protein